MLTGVKKYDEAKVPIHFRSWNESSKEQKFSGTKVPRNESSQERMFPTGNFHSLERKYRRAKRPRFLAKRKKYRYDTRQKP